MKSFKWLENLAQVLLRYANPVVLNGYRDLITIFAGCNLYLRRNSRTSEF